MTAIDLTLMSYETFQQLSRGQLENETITSNKFHFMLSGITYAWNVQTVERALAYMGMIDNPGHITSTNMKKLADVWYRMGS